MILFSISLPILCIIVLSFAYFFRRLKSNPKKFGKDYLIYESIGKGGMATVYRAHNKVLKRRIALKILKPAFRLDKTISYKFLKEGENIDLIRSKFPDAPVIKVLEYGRLQIKSGEFLFIAMDFLKGVNLRQLLDSRKHLSLEAKLTIVKEVARALAASHALEIFHRDVTPANIFVDNSKITLIDFGIAKHDFPDNLTFPGAVIGKPHYMSPEQCAGRRVNNKSDIYSLGAVFYHLLEGKAMYGESHNPYEVMEKQKTSPIPPLKSRVPEQVILLLYRMLEKKPGNRPDAVEVKEYLEGLLKAKRKSR
jgi:serine/threonine protein kinase